MIYLCLMGYFFWFWTKVARQAFYIIRSRKVETRRAYSLLKRIEEKFKGTFNPDTFRKIAVSYGIYNPMICDPFSLLHGRPTNKDEKKRFIHYFICSSLFDDFTDYQLITEGQLQAISFQPNDYKPASFDEKVFLYAHQILRDYVKDKKGYDLISHELFQAQMDSKKQYNTTLNKEKIKEITFKKGGNSVLLCRYYLDSDSSEVEEKCWYQIGTLIQLTNDLYDIYKDLQDNIATLPNQMKDAYAFEDFFIQQIQVIKTLIRQLPFSHKHKKEFSLSMAGIYSFGLIAIDQLKKIQGNNDFLPKLKALPRKELIIDMEKISNLAKWFKFTYKHARV